MGLYGDGFHPTIDLAVWLFQCDKEAGHCSVDGGVARAEGGEAARAVAFGHVLQGVDLAKLKPMRGRPGWLVVNDWRAVTRVSAMILLLPFYNRMSDYWYRSTFTVPPRTPASPLTSICCFVQLCIQVS